MSGFAADEKALYLEKVVCVVHIQEGRVPLVPIDEQSAADFILDLDKARSDLSAATVRRKYNIPGTEAQVWYSLRYVPAQTEKAEHIVVSPAFFRKSKPPKNKKSKAPQVADSWEMIPDFILPSEIHFPMIPEQINRFNVSGVEGVPTLELDCKLKRERIEQDCPTCS